MEGRAAGGVRRILDPGKMKLLSSIRIFLHHNAIETKIAEKAAKKTEKIRRNPKQAQKAN